MYMYSDIEYQEARAFEQEVPKLKKTMGWLRKVCSERNPMS